MMQTLTIRSLGWAGTEISCGEESVVIDPLADPAATFAPLGDAAAGAAVPEVVPPSPGSAVAGLVTHLHRDHADADALGRALAADGVVLEPETAGRSAGSGELDNLALAQAEHELAASGLNRRRLSPWQRADAAGFSVTALPAVDGLGDPQNSWVVEQRGLRVGHFGDTMFHGFWWRISHAFPELDAVLVPINGPRASFPHRQPVSPFAIAMDPEQAAAAVGLLGARRAIPMHFGGYGLEGIYDPAADPLARFRKAAGRYGFEVVTLDPGEEFVLEAQAGSSGS